MNPIAEATNEIPIQI